MNRWFKVLLFATIIGFAKAHYFIRVVILAALGLAGLWMVHTLAQDFNVIQGSLNNNQNDRDIFKRSILHQKHPPHINWALVLSRDPASCARSFLCQLAATDKDTLSSDEKAILQLVKHSSEEYSWESKQLIAALDSGKKAGQPSQCMKIYKYCPYTSQMMMALLQMFGR